MYVILNTKLRVCNFDRSKVLHVSAFTPYRRIYFRVDLYRHLYSASASSRELIVYPFFNIHMLFPLLSITFMIVINQIT